ncbi:MAG TPA: adenosylcobalamin-dependent ribonucleoside-diphosphate reductase [Bacteroidales bacterium]|nr:adenosylcobalamin-dependent ribonucleoside-diphosphate reductase [Bacteroidales bacterium]HPT09222.1 adenosylcobalamin-dependent ribonucleoside-diphosphate reductase [Bacteroidales bacterium]
MKEKKTIETNQKIYEFSEVVEQSTLYFGGDSLAANVWANKYALKNAEGHLLELTPDDMHRRIAREIARIEKKYPNPMGEEELFELMRHFRYLVPQGSPMAGIGNSFQIGSLSNCFVIGNEGSTDSYGAIMKTDEEQVQLMKRRGGVGHDLSHIRPKHSLVKNSAMTSTGIVPFMERYSNSTREVAQEGRRGALMLSISVVHPDSEHFIDAKLEAGKVTGANISVKITDEFMQAVINDTDFVQRFPVDSDHPTVTKTIKARELWKKIVHNAWKSAEPGILFWDTILRESIPDAYADLGFRTVSTNPCGEIPLCTYDSCRLMAINLYNYVDKPFTAEASFDSDLFIRHVHKGQRIMDDIIDLELEKIDRIIDKIDSDPENEEIKARERTMWFNIKKKAIQGRRTGFGITAEGDMLAALGTRYGSDEATAFSIEVHKILAIEAYRSSVMLARERGPFPLYDTTRELNNPFILRLKEAAPDVYEEMKNYGRRNIAMLTIAPTGSVSILTQTTSGLEPVFAVSYKRRRKVNPNDKNVKITFKDEMGDTWEEYNVFHHNFITWLKAKGFDPEEVSRMDEKDLKNILRKSPYFKATANDVDWVAKVKMQGAVQKWVDHSISVTVNVPNETKEELIGTIYETAWKVGCKGMTVYRDGSRAGVLVNNESKEKKKTKEENTEFRETRAPHRPDRLEAEVVRFQNDYEKWVAVVGILNGRPYEIFTGVSEDFWVPTWVQKGWIVKTRPDGVSSRYDFQFEDRQGYKITIEGLSRSFNKEYWNYAKLISGILRHGMPLPFVVNLISKLHFDVDSINTWKNGVERTLKKFIPDGTKAAERTCPKCNDQEGLVYQEGCLVCKSCGYSKCG